MQVFKESPEAIQEGIGRVVEGVLGDDRALLLEATKKGELLRRNYGDGEYGDWMKRIAQEFGGKSVAIAEQMMTTEEFASAGDADEFIKKLYGSLDAEGSWLRRCDPDMVRLAARYVCYPSTLESLRIPVGAGTRVGLERSAAGSPWGIYEKADEIDPRLRKKLAAEILAVGIVLHEDGALVSVSEADAKFVNSMALGRLSDDELKGEGLGTSDLPMVGKAVRQLYSAKEVLQEHVRNFLGAIYGENPQANDGNFKARLGDMYPPEATRRGLLPDVLELNKVNGMGGWVVHSLQKEASGL